INAIAPSKTESAQWRRRFGWGISCAVIGSKCEAHGKMQPHLTRLLAIGNVEAERSYRCAYPRANTIAEHETEIGNIVERLTGVDERRDSPRRIDPARCFEAANQIVPARNDGVAVFHAEAVECIAAHGRVATRAKQKRRRNFLTRGAEYGARLDARSELIIGAQRIPIPEPRDRAREAACRRAGNADACLTVEYPSPRGGDKVIDAAPDALHVKIYRMRRAFLGAAGIERI